MENIHLQQLIMKKILLLVLLIPSLAFAGQGMGPGPGVKGYAGGACSDTLRDSQTTIEAATNYGTIARKCWAYKFTTTSSPASYTVSKVDIHAYLTSSATQNTSVKFYTWSSGPGSILTNGTSTTDISAATFGSTPGSWQSVTFTSRPTLSASTSYAIAVCVDTADDVNNMMWDKIGNGGEGNNVGYYSADGASWSVLEDNAKGAFRIYSCE
jgi:hypothetical protein